MIARAEICVSRSTEVLGHFLFLCLASFLIFVVFCVQVRTLELSSEIGSSGSKKTSSNLNYTSLEWVKTEHHQRKLRSVTEGIMITSSIVTPQYVENESVESATFENHDYEEYDLSHVAPEVLVDLEPAEMILSHQQAVPQGRRKPVKDGFVRDQEAELLRLHNMYRSNVTPPAADMSFMEWNDELAKIAQDWANRCEFRHGFPEGHSFPGAMGQNLYMGWDPTGVRALLLWYEEYLDYDLDTLGCEPFKQCGHYTQMAWGESRLVGCGMKRCGTRKFLVVCHYSPPGNVVGSAPYIVGKPCSQCTSESGGLCTNNLCVTEDQCSRNEKNCDPVCSLQCHNCGVLDTDTCKCRCADGWDSLDCSRPCRDAHERCGQNPGWPTLTTCSMNHHAVGDIYCRKMCLKCRGIDNLNSEDTCCNGTICDDGYVIDTKHDLCNCMLLCPGPICRKYGESVSTVTTHDDRDAVYDTAPGDKSLYKTTPNYNGSLQGNISSVDNGSWYPTKNIYMIYLAFSIPMMMVLL